MKTSTSTLTFPPFRLDPANACLWRGTKRLALPPKDFAILHYLVTHAGQLVTHVELLKAVWPDAIVSPKGLKAFVRRLRLVLHDRADKPRFIETVHGQGYRFMGEVVSSQQSVVSSEELSGVRRPTSELKNTYSVFRPPHPAINLVGREAELARLHRWLEKAQSGDRQIVFVTGEPGIGKTALVEAFLHSLESSVQSPELQEEKQKAEIGTSNWELAGHDAKRRHPG